MGKYLLDSNIYINFYDRYYKQNIFPTFWNLIIPILNNNVIIPDIVVSENFQNPWFRTWIASNYTPEILQHKLYAEQWGSVLQHINDNSCYKDSALMSDRGWANVKIADPWIIAIALEERLTIVTSELKNPNLSNLTPSKSAKIPDVCQDLNVRCIDMNQFFSEVNFII